MYRWREGYTRGNISANKSWNRTNTSKPSSDGSVMKSVTVVGTCTARDSREIWAARTDGSLRKVRAGCRALPLGATLGASGHRSRPCSSGALEANGSCWGSAEAVGKAVRARDRTTGCMVMVAAGLVRRRCLSYSVSAVQVSVGAASGISPLRSYEP